MMVRRLVPGLLVAAALLAAAYTRNDRVIETTTLSHGAAECDSDGVSVSYEVAFVQDQTPPGYRVQTVTVDRIAPECEGHEIVVGLFSGPDTLARSWGTPISGNTMTLPLRRYPLVEPVDGVQVKIDEDILPPVDSTPTPSASPTTSESPSDAPQGGGTSAPEPVPSAIPPLQPDPNGEPLPLTECDPATSLCGTTGDDSAHISDGSLNSGPGNDTIAVVTDASSSNVDVDAGSGNDSIDLVISAPSGSTQRIVIDAGTGADRIALSFDDIQLGATVEITILAGGGDDMIELPASLPPGVTVRIVAGAGDDVVSASEGPAASGNPVMLAWLSGGYVIHGGPGADTLRGGLGSDLIRGGRAGDVIAGRAGHDLLRGGANGDVIRGEQGSDAVRGGRGSDSLYGGTGNDRLSGGASADACRGGRDDDSFRGCERRAQ